MKIRADFVTNSSSSSFVTITFKMKDGSMIISKSNMDDIGHGVDPEPIAMLSDEQMLDLLRNVESGEQLIAAIDSHYKGLYRVEKPDDNTSWTYSAYKEFNSEEVSAVTFNRVKQIIIHDVWDGDYGRSETDFFYDPATKEGYGKDYTEEQAVTDKRMDEIYKAIKEYIVDSFETQLPDDIVKNLSENEKYYSEKHDPDWKHPLFRLLEWINDIEGNYDEVLDAIGVNETEYQVINDMYWE